VTGRDVPAFSELLAGAGVLVRPASSGRATAGPVVLRLEEGRVVARSASVGTPLYEAGVEIGDVLVSLDGTALSAPGQIEEIAATRLPGDVLELVFQSRGQTLSARLTLVEDPRLEVLSYEDAGLTLTDAMRERRAEWLGSKVGGEIR
jgi:predicted metalloprotease with PDZ domain